MRYETSYTLTAALRVEAVKIFLRRRSTGSIVSAIIGLGGIAVLIFHRTSVEAGVVLGYAIGYFVFWWGAAQSRFRQARRAPIRQYSLVMDDQGLHITSETSFQFIAWDSITGAWKYPNQWIAFLGESYLLLPTSALTDEAKLFFDKMTIGRKTKR